MRIPSRTLLVLVIASLALAGGLVACAPPRGVPEKAAAAAGGEEDLGNDNSYGNFLAGRHAQQERDYAAAADFYSRGLKQDPSSRELLGRAFLLDLTQGRIAEAGALAGRMGQGEAPAGMVGLVRIVEKAGAGDYAAAEKLVAALPGEAADRFVGPLLLAWARAGLGHTAQAIAALQLFNQIPGIAPLKDLHVALITDLAGQAAAAERAYAAVLHANPHPGGRLVDLVGNFYERNGRPDEARRLYEGFAEAGEEADLVAPALARLRAGPAEKPRPRVATAAEGMGEALFDLAGILDHAETQDLALIYSRLVQYLRPGYVPAQLLIADVLANEHRPEEALAIEGGIDPASPFSWSARLRAAGNLQAAGRKEEAIAELKVLAKERPDQEQPWFLLGDLLRGEERYAEAAEAYDQAVARLGKPDPQQWGVYYSRGIALERSSQWPRAEADLRKALELQPDQPLVLNYLGYSWVDRGIHLEEALRMIGRAVELRPNDGYIVDSLGWANYRLGKYVQATQELEHAVELRPQDPTINDHLGDAYWRTGRLSEARYQWKRALQFGPEAEEVKTIEAKLAQGLDAPGPDGRAPAASSGAAQGG